MAQEGIYRKIYDLQVRIEAELEKEIGAAEVVQMGIAPAVASGDGNGDGVILKKEAAHG